MKVTRVNATNRVPDQNSRGETHPDWKRPFAIEPTLERDGCPDAEEDEHHEESPQAFACVEGADGICSQVAKLQDFVQQGMQDIPAASTNDSLEDFLARIKNSHRLDLRL